MPSLGTRSSAFVPKPRAAGRGPSQTEGPAPGLRPGAQLCATPLCGTLPGAKLAARHPAQRSAAGRVTGHRPGTRSGCAACQCVTPTHVQRRRHRRALRPSLGSAPGSAPGPPSAPPGSPGLWPQRIGPARPAAAPAESPADAEGPARTGTRQAPGSARPLSPARVCCGPDLTLGVSRAELALVSPDLRQLRDVPPPGSRGGTGADWAMGAGGPAACPECSPKPSRRPPGSGRVPAQGPGSPHGRTSGRNESGRAPHFVCPPRETLPVAGALQTEPRGTKTPRNAEKAPQTHGPLGLRRLRPRRGALTTASGVWRENGHGL